MLRDLREEIGDRKMEKLPGSRLQYRENAGHRRATGMEAARGGRQEKLTFLLR